MSASITERADLLEPRWFDKRRFRSDTTRCIEQRLVGAWFIVRQPPALASVRFIRTND
jgi:hypothetical protein